MAENILSNTAEAKWESFLEDLTGYPEVCDLTDNSLHGITYDNPEQMARYRRRILQSIAENSAPLPWVMLGNKFLSLASLTEQRQLYDVMLKSDGLSDLAFGSRQLDIGKANDEALNADVISISQMLQALLANLHNLRFADYLCINATRIDGGVETNMLAQAIARISVWNTFEVGIATFTKPSQVLDFSRVLEEEGFTQKGCKLQNLRFVVNIECLIITEEGFILDPLVEVLSKSSLNSVTLHVTTTSQKGERSSSLVSPNAFQGLLRSKIVSKIDLSGLCLDDRHCQTIKKEMTEKKFKSAYLFLKENPQITLSGYNTLVRSVSCDYNDHRHRYPRIIVDDPYWERQMQFVFDMDLRGRHKYVDLGAFLSRIKWIEWLIEVVCMDMLRIPNEGCLDGMKVGYIFHALLERPDFLRP